MDDSERELARIKVKAHRSQVAALLEFSGGPCGSRETRCAPGMPPPRSP
jgi:hypothetical protein